MATSVDREVKNLELLKLQFGDTALYDCEIMLRDVQDSNRLNELNQHQIVDAVILSCVFWPPIHGANVRLHWLFQRLELKHSEVP